MNEDSQLTVTPTPPEGWTTFIEPKPGVKYKCTACLDYGGIMSLTPNPNGSGWPEEQMCACAFEISILSRGLE